MELTDEIKTKIIAMYGECPCVTPDGEGIVKDISFLDSDVNVFLPGELGELKLFDINQIQLILKPIDQLSVDVAKEIALLLKKKEYHQDYTITEIKITTTETLKKGFYITDIDFTYEFALIGNIRPNGSGSYKIGIDNWGGTNIYVTSQGGRSIFPDSYGYFIYQILIEYGYDMPHYLLGKKTLKEAGLALYQEDLPEPATDANENPER